jgi:single-strand DNA-binding protein
VDAPLQRVFKAACLYTGRRVIVPSSTAGFAAPAIRPRRCDLRCSKPAADRRSGKTLRDRRAAAAEPGRIAMFLNEAQVSLTGYVATQPVTKMVKSGDAYLPVVSMRVAWTPRRQDRATGEWMDGNTSYVTVICWRKLATNAGLCVRKGDPVIVQGRLGIRTFEDKQGVLRNVVEIDANSIGHDLARGVALFQRVRPQTGMTASEYAASNGDQPRGDDDGFGPADGNGFGPADGGSSRQGSDLDADTLVSADGDDAEAVLGADQARDPEPVAAPF